MKNRREFLKLATAAGAAWPFAGCGSKSQSSAAANKNQTAATAKLQASVTGAFAYVFNQDHTRLELASVARPEPNAPGARCTFIDHPMGITVNSGVTVTTSLPTMKDTNGNLYYMCPAGPLTLKGVAAAEPALHGFINRDDGSVPTPKLGEAIEWNDFVWIPLLGPLSTAWRDRTTTRLLLDKGTLKVDKPGGTMEKALWSFTPELRPGSKRPPLLMAQSTNYEAQLDGDTLEIVSGANTIATLKTSDPFLTIHIGTPSHEAVRKYVKGDKVEFYAMFSELVDAQRSCADRPLPVFEQLTDGTPDPAKSDGNWCPPAHFVE